MPERIQLSRKKGWRKPENTVVVSRPSKWGNPFTISRRMDCDDKRVCFEIRAGNRIYVEHINDMASARLHARTLFRLHIGPMGSFEYDDASMQRLRAELAGKNLACWCPLDQPCHADVLLKLANETEPSDVLG